MTSSESPQIEELEGKLHRRRAEFHSTQERRNWIEQAFDYRGDVTLFLSAGGNVIGYVSNCNWTCPEPYLELFVKGEPSPRQVGIEQIIAIEFSGPDTAAGKSWDAWLKKVAEAEANGTIAEIYPESLED